MAFLPRTNFEFNSPKKIVFKDSLRCPTSHVFVKEVVCPTILLRKRRTQIMLAPKNGSILATLIEDEKED